MISISAYIENGRVNRTVIVDDIVSHKISEQDLSELLSYDSVRAAFFSNSKLEKKDKSEWTSDYLERITYMAISEVFDEEYLRYLFTISQYLLEKKKIHKRILVSSSIFLLVIVSCGVIIALLRNT